MSSNRQVRHEGRMVAASGRIDHPRLGRAGRVPGTGELVLGRTPHVVSYRIGEGQAEVIRALDGVARRIGYDEPAG